MDNIFKYVPAGGFESSTTNTDEFIKFFKAFKQEMQKDLKEVGATEIKINKGHFDISGFYKIKEQWYYFSLQDVRGGVDEIMIRTANDDKDFTGGINSWHNLQKGMFKDLYIE